MHGYQASIAALWNLTPMGSPYFSVLILNWKSEATLPDCLASLAAQTWQDFELILLNNGAEAELPPDLHLPGRQPGTILSSPVNLGFAGGNNLAAKSARSEYIVLLNADAFPEPDWLEEVHAATQAHPNCFFASRLLNAEDPQLLDGEWNVYHASGLAWRKNHKQAISLACPHEKEVLSACAAAGVYPRVAFEAVGGFDEDFFAYMEDLDLDLRLQLAAYRCYYLPQAKVRHLGSASTGARSAFQLYHGHRNIVWTFVKNMPGFLFYLLLPAHLLANLLYLFLALLIPSGSAILKGKADALKGLGKMLKKRKQVQATRKVSALKIARLLDWNPLSPLVKTKF